MTRKTPKGTDTANPTRQPSVEAQITGGQAPINGSATRIPILRAPHIPTTTHHPNPDLDAITSAPVVTVSAITSAQATTTTTPSARPLKNFWIKSPHALSPADAEGIRTNRGRKYVDVPDGGVVLVASEPGTGLYRAKLANELNASGPLLLRDPDSGLWHPQQDFEPATFSLSDTHLEAFRTRIDFTDVAPGSDGLHRHDGKLYAVIQHHGYQVLHDLDASTPHTPVMRIVRAEDAVAQSADNRYVATRPGRSQAIVFDPSQGWIGVNVGGSGGMRRRLTERVSTTVNRLKSPTERARELYPSFGEYQIQRIIQSLGDDVTGSLAHREAEYATLKATLSAWVLADQQTAHPADTPRARAAESLKRCWRRESSDILSIDLANEALPEIKADFSYVMELRMEAVVWSDTADAFLAGLPNLARLSVTRSTLDKLPASIDGRLSLLIDLDLSSNAIRLDEPAARKLGELTKLDNLNLSGNPLGTTPDFSALYNLRKVNLRNTQLEHWPNGLQTQKYLESIDLRNNQLRQIPEAILNPPAAQSERIGQINSVTLIEGNPFPPGYWRVLVAYWQRVTQQHPNLEPSPLTNAFVIGDTPEVAMVQRLYPDKSAQQAGAYFLDLDDAGAAQLTKRVQALDQLETELAKYVSDQNGNAIETAHASLAAPITAQRIKENFAQQLEALSLDLGNGPLPVLTADFGHVLELKLISPNWSSTADRFLAHFPNLETLSITGGNLNKLPAHLEKMGSLNTLDLRKNKIELDQQALTSLGKLKGLYTLNLSQNPLKLTPDFSGMRWLTTLDLSHTGIRHWPTGLRPAQTFHKLDLRHNQLTEVPLENLHPAPEHLESVAQLNSVTFLTGNPFPLHYARKFENYWKRLNRSRPDLLDYVDAKAFDADNSFTQRYSRLYPKENLKRVKKFLWRMDRVTTDNTLRRLELEHDTLKSQLDAWAYTGEAGRQQYIRANQPQADFATRRDRLEAHKRIMSCWRRETPQTFANDGTPLGLALKLSHLTLPSLPELKANFGHVSSLKLDHMNLTTSPERFLTRFRHLRWLDMSDNQLREIPPALGQMNGLTRLYLHRNQIRLTEDSARILSERTTLRALNLRDNPQLGIAPDFSRIPDMRSLWLNRTGIDTFPTGLAEQPLLDTVELIGNRISTIPDAYIAPPDERLAQTARINNVIDISDNPLSEATLARLELYRVRLENAGETLSDPNNLLSTSIAAPAFRAVNTTDTLLMRRWFSGLSAGQIAARTAQWNALRQYALSDSFFNTLERLVDTPASHPDLQRRVWVMMDAMSENTPGADKLRRELFDRAGEAGCCDRAAFTFGNLETRVMIYRALAQAKDPAQGVVLAKLSKDLFRLHEVDKIAAADIANSKNILAAGTASPDQLQQHRNRVAEEVEIRLAYRYKLKDRLDLPGQTEDARFIEFAHVTQPMLDAAYKKVLALDDSPEEFQALVEREFWQEYITHKYKTLFETQRQPYQDRQAILDDLFATKELTNTAYEAQSKALQNSLAKDETAQIETLTREELAMHRPAAKPLADTATKTD